MRVVLPFVGRGAASAVPPYRYWRLYITALNSSGTQVNINEVELRGTVGGTDITTSSTPVLESSFLDNGELGSYPGSATVDNDTTFSYWASAPGSPPHWVRYDLATAKTVAQVAIFASTNGASVCPRDFTIQGSDNGASWTDVKSFTAVAAWTSWQAFTL